MNIVKTKFDFIELLEPLNTITHLVLHHTSRENMTAEQCHIYHQQVRNWSGIGYNFFIEKNGVIKEGRGFRVGAHAYGHNRNSIGICMSGDFDLHQPTNEQWQSFYLLCQALLQKYNLTANQIYGHRELLNVTKTCPGININMQQVRNTVKISEKKSTQSNNTI